MCTVFLLNFNFVVLAFNCLLCHSMNDSVRQWDKKEGHGR